MLRSFYDGFKGLDEFLRALFITGVSKFSKTSIFSGLNNLNDISYDPVAAELVGYTDAELKKYFSVFIKDFVAAEATSEKEFLKKVKVRYKEYQFSAKPNNGRWSGA